MGVAPMTISPFARWLISAYDWRTAMFDIGVMAWVLLLPAALLVRQPPATLPPTRRRRCRRPRPVGRAGAALAAIHRARTHLLCLLRGAFRADLPHGELCDAVRRRADGGGQHLQRRGPRRARRPAALWRARRPDRRQAGAGRRARDPGARSSPPIWRSAGSAFLRARRHLRRDLRRRDAALCGAGARVFRAAHHRHGVRRCHDALQPRHGVRAACRRHGVRRLAGYAWLFIGSAIVGLGAAAVALAFPPLPRTPRANALAGARDDIGRF